MINFGICSIIYIFLSHRAFILTVTLRDMVIPKNGHNLISSISRFAVGVAVIAIVGHTLFAFAINAQ